MIFLTAPVYAAEAKPSRPTPELSWSQDLNKYPGLLNEFGRLFEEFQHNLQYPPERSASHLLPLLPESTVFYAAFPNYGDLTHQVLKIFRQELQESSVLRDWWRHGEMAATGPKVEDALEQAYQVSQYLGDEIVVSVGAQRPNPAVLVVAEVRKPGLKKFLQQMVKELGGNSKPAVRVLDLQELSIAADPLPRQELLVLVRPDFVVAALDLAALRGFNTRLEHGHLEFASTRFGQRAAQAYEGGATMLAAADVQKILALAPQGPIQSQMTFQLTGFADMKYLVWEHKSVGSQALSQAELSFAGPRRGVASWLAAPSLPGSLDFVSPQAMMAATLILKNPAEIFEDVKKLSTVSNPDAFMKLEQMEQMLNLSLKNDLLRHLGGEIAVELDDVNPPQPVWRAILRVSDPDRLQQTLSRLLALANLTTKPSESKGVTYYSLRIPSPKIAMEIGYAFVDGYLIIASSPDALEEAIRLHKTGESLGKSPKFLASLPPGHSSGVSAMLYQDPTAMMLLRLRQVVPEMAEVFAQAAGGMPAVMCAYGEESAIREASTSAAVDAGAVLAMAAIAIPNLLRARVAANEASAVSNIRTINTAQVTYAATYPNKGYARDLATLGHDLKASPGHASLIDANLGNASCTAGAWCTKSGFRFGMTAVCRQQVCKEFVVTASPVSSSTGGRNFCSTSDVVIRFKTAPPLTGPVSAQECKAWAPLQ